MAWALGKGESSVIDFALQLKNGIPIMDDQEGKSCALSLGLKPLGTGSLLIFAKRGGMILSVRDALLKLRAEGLWISDHVMEILVERAGE